MNTVPWMPRPAAAIGGESLPFDSRWSDAAQVQYMCEAWSLGRVDTICRCRRRTLPSGAPGPITPDFATTHFETTLRSRSCSARAAASTAANIATVPDIAEFATAIDRWKLSWLAVMLMPACPPIPAPHDGA